MRSDYYIQEEDEAVAELPTPQQEPWRARLRQAWPRLQRPALFAAGMLASLLALLVFQAFNPPPKQLTTDEVNEVVAQALASATALPAYSEFVYQVIQPSLVLIQSSSADATDGSSSVGSGVIINDQGDILTSLHVVTGSQTITVSFADGSESAAQISVAQPEIDIAVLTALSPPAQVVPATLGNPYGQSVGDEAFVVGNPYGIYSSMSAGVISGFHRTIKPEESDYTLENLIQIDAAVNPGNSGGPLLNRYGEVIGIVTGLVNPTDQNFFVGLGFAVPITTAAPAAGAPPY